MDLNKDPTCALARTPDVRFLVVQKSQTQKLMVIVLRPRRKRNNQLMIMSKRSIYLLFIHSIKTNEMCIRGIFYKPMQIENVKKERYFKSAFDQF